ncbi:MAG: activase, partial [Spirochaetales bacterium]|nr:activase [Spirochaetales bacterium]
SSFITGNRCERGEILGDPKDSKVKEKLKAATRHIDDVPDMMRRRKELLFADYEPAQVSPQKDMTIGLPRALEFWYSMPFWKALFTSLGFGVKISRESTRDLYEKGLPFVPSDTACFPAKVAHGHVLDLVGKKVDRIFFPMMLRAQPEHPQADSYFLCSVVQGYPLIIKESHRIEGEKLTPIDIPAFHWYDDNARNEQLVDWFNSTFGLPRDIVLAAIQEADKAQNSFNTLLQQEGAAVLDTLTREDKFGILLAARPYHNDMLVNHDLSRYFTRKGIAVLTIDSLPGIWNTDLSRIRTDLVNNFHVRMFSAAVCAAEHPALELVQIVSFGCGHDAVLSDEVSRIMKDISGKDPLILKLDESDVPGPLNIRVTSFVETVSAKRKGHITQEIKPLGDPYPVRFQKKDKKHKAVLIPTLSPSFSIICASVFRKEGLKAICLPVAESRAIELGKKYVHNDMCYPAQLNIGEALAFLEKHPHPEEIAVGLAHEECDCRLSHYATVARKALDDAGFADVPIVTTGKDKKGMHPGLRLGPSFSYRMLHGIIICDFIDAMARRLRPYEKNQGEVAELHSRMIRRTARAFESSIKEAISVFDEAVEAFNRVELLDIPRKPRVFVIGEILLNYHPASNAYIESYLEANGMEVIMPPMIDAFKKESATVKESMKRFHVRFPLAFAIENIITDFLIDAKLEKLEKRYMNFIKFETKEKYHDLSRHIEGLVDKVFNSGKGWLIPADIIEYAKKGVNSFVILQPFGCLPNHIMGRGIMKTVKKQFPHIQVLSLDFDPDTSLANIENRLQMLIINAKEMQKAAAAAKTELKKHVY